MNNMVITNTNSYGGGYYNPNEEDEEKNEDTKPKIPTPGDLLGSGIVGGYDLDIFTPI